MASAFYERVYEGAVMLGVTLQFMYMRSPATGEIKSISFYRGTAGSVLGTHYLNVRLDGAALFAGAGRPTFGPGVLSVDKTGLSVATVKGDVILVDYEQKTGFGVLVGPITVVFEIDDGVDAGGISGPVASTDEALALWEGTDGDELKDSAKTLSTDGTLASNSDAKIPTEKAVKTYADSLIAAANALIYKGTIDCSANPNYPAADAGWLYIVSVAGKIGGGSGPKVEVGDWLVCKTDSTASGNHATVGAQWGIIQTNLDVSTFMLTVLTSVDAAAAKAALGISGTVDIQVFNTAGTHTWTNPSPGTAKPVQVLLWGGGGGGGGGTWNSTGTAVQGGCGGCGGGHGERTFVTTDLGSSEDVVVGAAGTGGTGASVVDTAGGDGTQGGNTTFGTTVRFAAGGGGGGRGGSSVSGATRTSCEGGACSLSTTNIRGRTGLGTSPILGTMNIAAAAGAVSGVTGAGNTNGQPGNQAEYGGASASSSGSINGANSVYGGPAGGTGGSSNTGVANNGGAGGNAGVWDTSNPGGGGAGGNGTVGGNGVAGSNGANGSSLKSGTGGGGGGASTGANFSGGAGGNAGSPSAGGGGGGSKRQSAGGTGKGGDGGTGGIGQAIVITYL